MNTKTSRSTELFVSGFTHLDCAYLDPAHGLVGESWLVDARLSGTLDADGMICDFGIVKPWLKSALDDFIDHRLILLPSTPIDQQQSGDSCELTHSDRAGRRLRYRAPQSALCRLDAASLQPADLAAALSTWLKPRLPAALTQVVLSLRCETQRSQYHYCHGLQRHAGNCQRMAHGHRGRLGIRLNDSPAPWLESHWSQKLAHRFIGTEAHRLSDSPVGRHGFAYRASQGEFELELPEDRVYLIRSDATVECLAQHIAGRIAKEHPRQRIEVTAYEGIGKGAVATIAP